MYARKSIRTDIHTHSDDECNQHLWEIVLYFISAYNVKVTRGALGLVGESPGVTVFCFIMRR